MQDIEMKQQLDVRQQQQVASLFYEAFPLKMKHLWFRTRTKDQAMKLLLHSITFAQGIYALRENNVVGFIGYTTYKQMGSGPVTAKAGFRKVIFMKKDVGSIQK